MKSLLANATLALVLVAACLLFVSNAVGQEKTCGLTLRVVEADGKTEISDSYAEAYSTELSKKFHASRNASLHIFDGLRSGFYHFTVQKRGYKASRYFHDVNCSQFPGVQKDLIIVPLIEGMISEQENVTPQTPTKAEQIDGDLKVTKFSGPLTQKDSARIFNFLNFDAVELGKATYPSAAMAVKASGVVNVHVIVNEKGEVESAEAVSGHPLLRTAAQKAAEKSKFNVTLVNDKPIKIQGLIVYSFVP